MSYIGREPLGGEVIHMNSIESQFNGVKTTLNLTHTISGVTSVRLDYLVIQTSSTVHVTPHDHN